MGKTELKADQIETTSFEQKVETAVNTGTVSDDLVHKNGDTMTGQLTVPTLQVGSSQIIFKTDENNKYVGIKTDEPKSPLHINGDIRITSGGLQFTDTLTEDPKLVLYKGGTDFGILRRYGDDYTILQIWAPSETWFNSNEATLSLVRGDEPNQEYIDLYTMNYGDPKHGIRIQKRGTGQYRPFVFEFSDGNTTEEIVKIEDNKTTINKELDINNTLKVSDAIYVNNDRVSVLPIGTILMYDGTGIADVETRTEDIGDRTGDTISLPGWKVCNGQAGTPNLINKFIRGEAASGNTGGSDDAVVVSHTHGSGYTGYSDPDFNHRHYNGERIQSTDSLGVWWTVYGQTTASQGTNYTAAKSGSTHTARQGYTSYTDKSMSHRHTIGSTGVDGTGKNMPAYYSVIFIKRVS